MKKEIIELDGHTLSIEDMIAVTREFIPIKLSAKGKKRIVQASEIVQDILKENRRMYGINTGFGYLQKRSISPNDIEKQQHNLIKSHSAGVGPELPQDIVRGMIVLQVNEFARGHSGIRLKVVSHLIELLTKNITPIVPSKGSLGASGDLAPLAHLALVLIGLGLAEYDGIRLPGDQALKKCGLSPLKLIAKEGLALLNGTQAMTSIAALVVADAEYLVNIANIAVAMSMEVHQANVDALHPLIHQARPHKGQIDAASIIRKNLKGSKRIRENVSNQDSYSLRCAPIVHGAAMDTITHVRKVVETEINSSTDNPLIFSSNQIFSGGNFHGQPIAFAMDFLSIALAKLGSISERRIERLLNPTHSGLPAFLAPQSGLNSGLMIAQYTAAALVSENKGLAFPASIDSIPVSANQEDFVSMGTIAANQAREVVKNLQYILAIELLCASQAIDMAGIQDQISPTIEKAYRTVRTVIPKLEEDRELSLDINLCVELILNKQL